LLLLQATFQSPRLIESSGVAVSHAYPGVLWTHNDSGDGPYVYATDLHGTDRGALLVPGAQAIDWEDISLGPCPVNFVPRAGSCIYLAWTAAPGAPPARRSTSSSRPWCRRSISGPALWRAGSSRPARSEQMAVSLRYGPTQRSTCSIQGLGDAWCRRASAPVTSPG